VSAPPREAAHAAHLHRVLGLAGTTTLVAGSMIGSGIFLVPAQMMRELEAASWLLVVWDYGLAITCARAAGKRS